jgi:tryptophan-rich sensory protein
MISRNDNIKAYGIGFVSVIITSLLGSYFTKDSVKTDWYKSKRTKITPPSYIFPIAWTLLYILLAIVIGKSILLKEYIVTVLLFISLILHVTWCYLYFNNKNTKNAFINILTILIAGFLMAFLSKDTTIIKLLIPYISWITFASAINYDTIDK